jgi:TetR/AcrR family transcriptional regulator
MRARGKGTREAILRAAEQAFAERGYVGARMDDVAAEVGIKRASMVHYFRDKRSLYLALLEDLFGGLHHQYLNVLTGDGTLRDRILGCIDVWASQVTSRPGMMRILLWESARVRPPSNPLAKELAPVLATMADAIVAGQREGAFRPVDPLRFMMIVAGSTAFLTLGIGAFATEATPLDVEQLRRELRQLAVRILFQD